MSEQFQRKGPEDITKEQWITILVDPDIIKRGRCPVTEFAI
jgi:hypothetical protein